MRGLRNTETIDSRIHAPGFLFGFLFGFVCDFFLGFWGGVVVVVWPIYASVSKFARCLRVLDLRVPELEFFCFVW